MYFTHGYNPIKNNYDATAAVHVKKNLNGCIMYLHAFIDYLCTTPEDKYTYYGCYETRGQLDRLRNVNRFFLIADNISILCRDVAVLLSHYTYTD